MKQKIFFLFIVVLLIAFNIYSLLRFNKLKQQNSLSNQIILQNEERKNNDLNTYKTSFAEGLLNNGKKLKDLVMKDSLSNIIPLKEVFTEEQNRILIYRFSKMHCESCVVASMEVLKKQVDSIGVKNIMLLGNYRNNRVFYRTILEYGTENMKVYNAPSFNIPAEDIGYPYFFVLNSNLKISHMFVPNKATPQITNKYLESIQKKF